MDKELQFQLTINKLNHISGCGYPTTVLRQRILDYMWEHGGVDSWHSINDVFKTTFAWQQFGKRVADPLLLLMVGYGEIEIDTLPNPTMMRRL